MIVRIRFGRSGKVERKRRKNQRVALALASLLVPVAVMASALGIWRMLADLKVAGDFAISNGLFSHWQVWIASGAALLVAAHILNRYGQSDDRATP